MSKFFRKYRRNTRRKDISNYLSEASNKFVEVYEEIPKQSEVHPSTVRKIIHYQMERHLPGGHPS